MTRPGNALRILWLAPYLPLPIFGGGTRVFNLIKVFAATCDIDLIASDSMPPEDDENLAHLRALCRTVEIVPRPASSQRSKRLWQLRAAFSRHPSQYWLSYAPAVQERIDRAVRAVRYDVVIVEHSFMGYYALPPEVPVVLDQHNVESDILRRASTSERSTLRRVYNLLDYLKFRSDERRISRAADLILATSESDRRTLQRWERLPPCVVIPNGVDSTSFVPPADAEAQEQPASIVFTASMHYAPNVEAMLYFAAKIWPLIRERVPTATLSIVGGNPPPEIARLGQLPNVTVHGHVPDMRPYLASAAVVVVPLRFGGGTRLKIVEALSMGRAVVSTTLGCEGLAVHNGRHLLVADEPEEFAARVVELQSDPARRAALGREGRRLAKEVYDWQAIGHRLAVALRDIGVQPRPPDGRTACDADTAMPTAGV